MQFTIPPDAAHNTTQLFYCVNERKYFFVWFDAESTGSDHE
jgi:hypothetical protein